MNRDTAYALSAIFIIFLLLSGCSSVGKNCIVPGISATEKNQLSLLSVDDFSYGKHLATLWDVNFDLSNLSTEITSLREPAYHFNPTGLIPSPVITINNYNPTTNIVDVNVKITNSTGIDVYDVRLIIFTDNAGHMLFNADDWTPLFDIPGGYVINPFVSYAKNEPNRIFRAHSEQTGNLLIYLPQGNTNVRFAIDVSVPGNCSEPYSIENFTQGSLYEAGEGSAEISIDVFDWQDDVTEVLLHCSQVTGMPQVALTHKIQNTWDAQIENTAGASAGEYLGIISAKSQNSGSLALYDLVTITVLPGMPEPLNPHLVGSIEDQLQNCKYIHIYGDYAYIDDHLSYLAVVDISDPLNPELVNKIENIWILDMAFQGDYAYTFDLRSGANYAFKIFDISNPAEIHLVGMLPLENGNPITLTVFGNYAYLTLPQNNHLFYVIDISDPTAPVIVNSLSISLTGELIAYDGHLFMAGQGIKIYNLDDPVNPVEVGYIDAPATRFRIQGNYLYCISAGFMSKFSIVDISDYSNPQILYSEFLSGSCISVEGNYVFIKTSDELSEGALVIFDVSNPAYAFATSDYTDIPTIFADVKDQKVFLVNNDGLFVLDVQDAYHPQLVTEFDGIGTLNSLAVFGDYAYAARSSSFEAGVYLLDISNPENPEILDFGNFENTPNITAYKNYLCITEARNLWIMDVSDVFNPVEISYMKFSGGISKYTLIADDLIFLQVTSQNKITIVDISDPESPAIRGSCEVYFVLDMFKNGDYLYVCDSDYGLMIFDVSDPNNPQEKSRLSIKQASEVAVKDNHAYVYEPNITINVVDVSNPTTPVIDCEYRTGLIHDEGCFQLYKDKYLICNSGITVIDITDPHNLKTTSSMSLRVDYFEAVDRYVYGIDESGFYIAALW